MAKTVIYTTERILVLAKTYPSPSAGYVETSCIAGITENKEMRRLYPVPFRLLDKDMQFKKWQWIEVNTGLNPNDDRPESRKIDFNSIKLLSEIKTVKKPHRSPSWEKRLLWINEIKTVEYFKPGAGNDLCVPDKVSLALYTPPSDYHLEIRKSSAEFTHEQLVKLKQFENENSLFTPEEAGLPAYRLQKIPYDFYYVFNGKLPDGKTKEVKLKITDWESGALYFNCKKSDGDNWQIPFRKKMETDMKKRDLRLLLGNMHTHQNQWLMISLIQPPKTGTDSAAQVSLF